MGRIAEPIAERSMGSRKGATSSRSRSMSGGLKRLVPLMDRVLVSRVEPLKKSVGGVILPDSAVSKVNEGNIIPMSVKEGDTVLLPEYGGTQVKIDDKDF